MGWIGCVHCEKFRCDFMAQTFALIAPIQSILHRVLCSNKTLPNALKHYQTHQNMSLGSNGVDRVHSLRKIQAPLRGMNFYINCTSSARFHRVYCRNKTIPNAPEHYETHQKKSLGSYGLDRVCSLRKILTQLRGTNFCINFINSAHFASSLCTNKTFQMHPNTTKCTKTWL